MKQFFFSNKDQDMVQWNSTVPMAYGFLVFELSMLSNVLLEDRSVTLRLCTWLNYQEWNFIITGFSFSLSSYVVPPSKEYCTAISCGTKVFHTFNKIL